MWLFTQPTDTLADVFSEPGQLCSILGLTPHVHSLMAIPTWVETTDMLKMKEDMERYEIDPAQLN